MRYVIFSDIHANLPALEAVLADATKAGKAAIYHLGDLVGYGPWPNETVALLRERGIPGVAGNYDSTVATDYKHCGCRTDTPRDEELSHFSYEWTRKAVSAETKSFLGALPYRIDIRPLGGHVAGPSLILLHAHANNNLIYVTEDRTDQFLSKLGEQSGAKQGDLVCFGHTHKPWHRVVEGVHFINTGSVGRPKDGDPRACYLVLDVSESAPIVSFVRVQYEIEKAVRAIAEHGLPEEFGEVLRNGA